MGYLVNSNVWIVDFMNVMNEENYNSISELSNAVVK